MSNWFWISERHYRFHATNRKLNVFEKTKNLGTVAIAAGSQGFFVGYFSTT